MPPKRARKPQEPAILPGTGGTAVWASRDRYEAAERRIEDLEAENRALRRLLLSHGISDPMLATGKRVKRT